MVRVCLVFKKLSDCLLKWWPLLAFSPAVIENFCCFTSLTGPAVSVVDFGGSVAV